MSGAAQARGAARRRPPRAEAMEGRGFADRSRDPGFLVERRWQAPSPNPSDILARKPASCCDRTPRRVVVLGGVRSHAEKEAALSSRPSMPASRMASVAEGNDVQEPIKDGESREISPGPDPPGEDAGGVGVAGQRTARAVRFWSHRGGTGIRRRRSRGPSRRAPSVQPRRRRDRESMRSAVLRFAATWLALSLALTPPIRGGRCRGPGILPHLPWRVGHQPVRGFAWRVGARRPRGVSRLRARCSRVRALSPGCQRLPSFSRHGGSAMRGLPCEDRGGASRIGACEGGRGCGGLRRMPRRSTRRPADKGVYRRIVRPVSRRCRPRLRRECTRRRALQGRHRSLDLP